MPPHPGNDYAISGRDKLTPDLWNDVMASLSQRLAARELLEATFEALIADGTQAALDLIQVNVGPQLETLTAQIAALADQLAEIIGGGTAANSLLFGGQTPAFYRSLANATGSLPVAQISGLDAVVQAYIDALKGGVGTALDTLVEFAAAIGNDPNHAATMMTALGLRLRVDAAQGLTAAQTLQARQNLGIASAIDGFLTASDLAAARSVLGVRPYVIGEEIWGSFTSLPPLCVWANGQNLSRTTYASLMLATVIAGNFAGASGASVVAVTVANTDLGSEIQIGMPVECAGIQAGTTIANVVLASGTTYNITLSLPTTAILNSGGAIFPNGNGNGTTTFGVADWRDRAGVGRGNMGGTAAGRLTLANAGFNSSRLGAAGGDERMQSHAHAKGILPVGQVPVTSNPQTYYALQGDGSTYNSNTGSAGAGNSQNVQPSLVRNVVIFAGA
ncbi:hypothetical protein AB4099_05545 [Bosea sp. 2KB_26]|uniref:hypothetical protein n=1 Tax=Bosea sp. 2KB_26 TaxID=3237475 RepID=UPI003F92BCDA